MMPTRISSRTGRMMANSTITAPWSSRLILDIVELLRASADRSWVAGAGDARSRQSQHLSLQLDAPEQAVDLTGEELHRGDEEHGDEGDEDGVLDHRGALVALAMGGDPRLDEGDDAAHVRIDLLVPHLRPLRRRPTECEL